LRIGDDLVDRLYWRPPQVRLRAEDLSPLFTALGGEDLVEQRDQLAGVLRPVGKGPEAGVFDPFRVTHDPRQRRPVPFSL
jgi:hypothetical protein